MVSVAKAASEAQYEVLDPNGILPDVEIIPLADRIAVLNDKTVYFIKSWPLGSGFEDVFEHLAEAIKVRFPRVEIIIKDRNVRYSLDDQKLWAEMKQGCDAFVYAGAPSSKSRTFSMKRALPTVYLSSRPLKKMWLQC